VKCRICGRVLFYDATDGLQIGPVCAKARGLLPEPRHRIRIIEPHRMDADPRQIDWINTGMAGESARA
jgi:hypothetical protein